MPARKSVASILIFIGSLMCFSLPFVTVSCGGNVTLTGKDLATGTVINQRHTNPDLFAVAAVLCAVAGVGLSMIGRNMAKPALGVGAVGAAALVVMRSNIETQVRQQTGGTGTVTTEMGFNLALLLLVAGAIWNGIMVLTDEDY
jgi:hypothetical protein